MGGCFAVSCSDPAPLGHLVCGTAYYCAPEVWVNEYGPKIDVWAAGVVMYLAMLGTFPFYHQDPSDLEAVICNPRVTPSFQPTKVKQCPYYQVSSWAREFLELLLAKDAQQRPNAEEALSNAWLQARLDPHNLDASGRSASMCSDSHLLNMGDQAIPAEVRAKAGKAAARPEVDPQTERARSTALENLKEKYLGHSDLKRDHSLSRISEEGMFETWREEDEEEADEDEQGHQDHHDTDLQPAETLLTDSDVDEDAAMCGCTRLGSDARRW